MKKFFGFFKGLICEGNKNTLSIGRVLLWIVIIYMCMYWKMGINAGKAIEMPNSLLYFGYAMLGYNLGKKIRDILKLLIEFKFGPTIITPNVPENNKNGASDILMED